MMISMIAALALTSAVFAQAQDTEQETEVEVNYQANDVQFEGNTGGVTGSVGSVNAGVKVKCPGRRRLAGVEVEVSDVCEHITELVRENMKDDFIALFLDHAGEDQHEALIQGNRKVIELCGEQLSEFEANQCKWYLELLPLVDSQDLILKAALVDAFGDFEDHHSGCGAVVNSVNERIEALAEADDSPVQIDEDGSVMWMADPTEAVTELDNAIVALTENVRRRLASSPVKSLIEPARDLSCTVVGGAAAAVVSGAAMVGVAIGTVCKAFATHSAPRFIEHIPL